MTCGSEIVKRYQTYWNINALHCFTQEHCGSYKYHVSCIRDHSLATCQGVHFFLDGHYLVQLVHKHTDTHYYSHTTLYMTSYTRYQTAKRGITRSQNLVKLFFTSPSQICCAYTLPN